MNPSGGASDLTPEQVLNAEMAKRLKYTKDMLTHMLQDANGHQNTRMTGGGQMSMSNNMGAGM